MGLLKMVTQSKSPVMPTSEGVPHLGTGHYLCMNEILNQGGGGGGGGATCHV